MDCGVDTRQLKRHWLNYPNVGFILILNVMSIVIINFEAIIFCNLKKNTYRKPLTNRSRLIKDWDVFVYLISIFEFNR